MPFLKVGQRQKVVGDLPALQTTSILPNKYVSYIEGTIIYSIAHPLVRDIVMNVFGKFPLLVGDTSATYSPSRPSQLAWKNITKYGEQRDTQRCMALCQ